MLSLDRLEAAHLGVHRLEGGLVEYHRVPEAQDAGGVCASVARGEEAREQEGSQLRISPMMTVT